MHTWSQFTKQLKAYNATHALMPPGSAVLLGVSGGVDSMMLMEGMARSRDAMGLSRLGAVYIDHGMRPTQTPAEAAFVEARAAELGLSFVVRYLTISVEGGSFQDAARQARRAALEDLAAEEAWDVIATGHHRDDQAETLLLRLLRGTSPGGLGGIAPQAGRWVHPLLPFSRAALQALAESNEVTWHEDPSNQSFKYLRNRVRHELLPSLEQTYNPRLRQQLARLSDQARADEAYMQAQLSGSYGPPLVTPCEGGLILDLPRWDLLPGPLQWRCLQRMIGDVAGGALPLLHIEELVAMAKRRDGEKLLPLPEDLRGVRCYQTLRLTTATPTPDGTQAATNTPGDLAPLTTSITPTVLDFGGKEEGALACWGGELEWRRCSANDPALLTSPWEAYLPEDKGVGSWEVRNRHPGDVLHFDFGRRPLKKWMIDAKIPRSVRYQVPLLTHSAAREGTDRALAIVWVIGHRRLAPLVATRPPLGWWFRFVPLKR